VVLHSILVLLLLLLTSFVAFNSASCLRRFEFSSLVDVYYRVVHVGLDLIRCRSFLLFFFADTPFYMPFSCASSWSFFYLGFFFFVYLIFFVFLWPKFFGWCLLSFTLLLDLLIFGLFTFGWAFGPIIWAFYCRPFLWAFLILWPILDRWLLLFLCGFRLLSIVCI